MSEANEITALWAEMIALVPVPEAAKADLHARMSDPARHYHGLNHITLLWQRHKAFGRGQSITAAPWHQRITCAIAFHDAVYVPRAKDNEALSAALWREAKPALDAEGIDWVAGTIEATADHLAAGRPPALSDAGWQARLWMLDLDLSPLGETPEVFDANTGDLRREFAAIPDVQWESGRVSFLKGLLAKPALYRTPVLAAAFEAQARANLNRVTGGYSA